MIKVAPKQKNKGFTLVEMLLSISLFSIVLVVILGSILTIIDINRKSQSLTIVMNDLNFSMESFTRSIKTGKIDSAWFNGCASQLGGCSNIIVTNQEGNRVEYRLPDPDADGRGKIQRKIGGGGEWVSITSNQIDIQNFEVRTFDTSRQPRVLILISGEVRTSPKISSDFSIQTTISQRDLSISNIAILNP